MADTGSFDAQGHCDVFRSNHGLSEGQSDSCWENYYNNMEDFFNPEYHSIVDETVCSEIPTETENEVECHYSCSQCVGELANECQTCESNYHRVLAGDSPNSCDCEDKYYDNGIDSECQACHYSCKTCEDSGNENCSTCSQSNYRYLSDELQPSLCQCLDGYYDDGSNEECKQCHYTCATCNDSAFDSCSTCDASDNRFMYITSTHDLCECLEGYYDDGLNSLCLKCHSTCTTCYDDSECAKETEEIKEDEEQIDEKEQVDEEELISKDKKTNPTSSNKKSKNNNNGFLSGPTNEP